MSAAYIAGYIAKYRGSAIDGNGGLARLLSHSVQTRSPAVHVSSPKAISAQAQRSSRRAHTRAAQMATASTSAAV